MYCIKKSLYVNLKLRVKNASSLSTKLFELFTLSNFSLTILARFQRKRYVLISSGIDEARSNVNNKSMWYTFPPRSISSVTEIF